MTAGKRYLPGGIVDPALQFEYSYDSIGNMTTNGPLKNGVPMWTFTADDYNRLPTRQWGSSAMIMGTVAGNGTGVTVTVGNTAASQAGGRFASWLPLSNNTASALQTVTVQAFQKSFYAVGTSHWASVSGTVYVAAATESVNYAASGVIQQDSRWTWTFNGWDRLVCGVSSNLSPNQKVAFSYYPDGQRATKTVYQDNGGTWDKTFTHAFVYDGWNLVREEITCHTGVTARVTIKDYFWGLDLAGKKDGRYGQSAGGIGGLLAISVKDSSATNVYLVVSDHQGSVQKLVNMATAQVVAEFYYSPFGALAGDWYADAGTEDRIGGSGFRFMTKYYDAETEQLYFGYRYYDAATAKWLVPDPMEETLREPNITAFCANDPVNGWDPLGLWNAGGHYYTVLYIALAAGYSKNDALELAFFSQYPDYVSEYVAWDYCHPTRNPLTIGIDSLGVADFAILEVGHSLLDRPAIQLRVAYGRHWKTLSSLSERGILLHAFGDLYGHAYTQDDTDILYTPIGHGEKLNGPDHIGEHYDQYEKYVRALYALILPTGKKGNDAMIEKLLDDTKYFSDRYKVFGFPIYQARDEVEAMKEKAKDALREVGGVLPEFDPTETVPLGDIRKRASSYGLRSRQGLMDMPDYLRYLRMAQSWIP
ncbi:MAG: RHS repeat-associated core domain-containing protein [bacterium]